VAFEGNCVKALEIENPAEPDASHAVLPTAWLSCLVLVCCQDWRL